MADPVIYVGVDAIQELFVGDMGIKEIYIGDDMIYTRPGGYFYLILDTTESE